MRSIYFNKKKHIFIKKKFFFYEPFISNFCFHSVLILVPKGNKHIYMRLFFFNREENIYVNGTFSQYPGLR